MHETIRCVAVRTLSHATNRRHSPPESSSKGTRFFIGLSPAPTTEIAIVLEIKKRITPVRLMMLIPKMEMKENVTTPVEVSKAYEAC